MSYWLFKSEPETFSIDDLSKKPHQTTHWEGVRNYQARNFLRDQMKVGDRGFFYHSSCKAPGIVGTIEVVKSGYPDFTAWDPQSIYYDASSTKTNPRWFMVDIKLINKFDHVITLEMMRKIPLLKDMQVLRKGNRLSITPVTEVEWRCVTDRLVNPLCFK